MTPEHIKDVFNANAIFIMFAWGLLVKYVPLLAKIPNWSIGWINLVGYIVTSLATGVAHASVGSDTAFEAGKVILGGVTSAGWAMVVYETLGRALMERIFKRKKAVAK